jgi:hypothetical protein
VIDYYKGSFEKTLRDYDVVLNSLDAQKLQTSNDKTWLTPPVEPLGENPL